MRITMRHTFGIRHYRIHHLHLRAANTARTHVDRTYNDWGDGFMAYDYEYIDDFRDYDVLDDQNN